MDRSVIHQETYDFIFSFAGGGTDGLGSLEIINVMSNRLQKRGISERQFLDFLRDDCLLVGTSTGSIVASLLKSNKKNPDTLKDYTLEDFKNMYIELSPKIFSPSLRWLAGLCIAPFSRKSLEEASYKYLGTQKIYETDGLGITVFNKSSNKSELIAKHSVHNEYTLGDSAQASAAIPCAFAPKVIGDESYSDGGTCLANLHPTIESYIYYKKLRKLEPSKYKASSLVVVDIGAGTFLSSVKSLIGSKNEGGLFATCLDSSICECAQHLQISGPEIVEEIAKTEESVAMAVYKIDFPMQFPLSFMKSCLTKTVDVAEESANKYEKMDELIDLVYYVIKNK